MKHISPGAFALANPLGQVPRAIAGAVRADTSDPKAMIAAVQSAFEEFKKAHDEKLNAKVDDVVLTEKIGRIDSSIDNFQAAIDELNTKIASNQLGGPEKTHASQFDDREYLEQFKAFSRGNVSEQEVKAKQYSGVRAALSTGSATDGGILAPIEWDRNITDRLRITSPMREHAQVMSITDKGFKTVFVGGGFGTGWVGETAARPQTSTPTFTELTFDTGELYANPAATEQMIEDTAFDLEGWLQTEVEKQFARDENVAFLSGDGVNKPFGLLTYATGAANAAKHPFGAIPTVNSGAAAALTADGMISIIYDLPAAYSANAKFFSNRQTIALLRKLKDGQGNFLWQPSYAAGEPSTLAGVPVVDFPDMPSVAAGNIAAAYGDMSETYLIVDRIGFRVLRDPFTNKPFIMFYCRKRVGGGVKNPEAMRFLKISA